METEPIHIEDSFQKSARKGNHILGQLTAMGMGLGVGIINKEHGPLSATVAGLKQYFYSAIIAVLLIDSQHRLYDHFRQNDRETMKPDMLAVALPSLSTILGTYILHSLKGTPETLASTIPTIILAPIGYTILHVRRMLKELENIKIDL